MTRLILSLLLWASCANSFTPGVPTFHRSQASSTHTITRAEHQHQSIGSSHDCHASETETATAGAMTRNSVLKHLGVGVAGVLSAAALGGGSVPALADNALIATKQSYFRYVPRILESLAWYQGDLQAAITAEDWPKVLTYFEVVNTAGPNSARPAMYQSSSSRMQRELFSPLSVWAQSMSIKGTGPKLRALLAQEEIVEKSMTSLQKAAEGKGLRDGESQGQMAKAAWEEGRAALQEYVAVANKGMVRQLRKLETPFS